MPTPNFIKYSTSSDSKAIRSGNFTIGVTSGVTYGPTDVTNYWSGISPPNGGYTLYENKAANGPSIRVPANSSVLIDYANKYYSGSSITTEAGALTYFNSLNTVICVNRDYEEIVTSGLTFLVDVGFTPSYPKSGNNWINLGFSAITGTLTNSPTYSSSNGGSLVFNGSNQYVTFGNQNLGLDLISKSFCAWVNLGSTLASPTGIIDKDFDTGPGVYGGWGFWVSSARKLWWWNTANQDIIDTGTTIGTSVWTHVAVTYNSSSKTATFYVNGSLSSSISNSSISELSSGTQPLVIGCIRNGVGGFLNGQVANVAAYNRVLSAAEILQNYSAQRSRFGV